MGGTRPRRLLGAALAGMIAAPPALPAADDLMWLHDAGEWGAWGAYALPESDHVIFSFGCTDLTAGIQLHVELPVFGLSEGEPAWIELRRDGLTQRYDGRVIFNEMLSEHQVVAHAPEEAATFDALAGFLSTPGSFAAAVPDGEETVPVDGAAAEALAAVRRACLER